MSSAKIAGREKNLNGGLIKAVQFVLMPVGPTVIDLKANVTVIRFGGSNEAHEHQEKWRF